MAQQPKERSIYGDPTLVCHGTEGVAEREVLITVDRKQTRGMDTGLPPLRWFPFSIFLLWLPTSRIVLPAFRVSLPASVHRSYRHTQRWASPVSHMVLNLTPTMINHHTRPEHPSIPGDYAIAWIPVIPETGWFLLMSYSSSCILYSIFRGREVERIGIVHTLF